MLISISLEVLKTHPMKHMATGDQQHFIPLEIITANWTHILRRKFLKGFRFNVNPLSLV